MSTNLTLDLIRSTPRSSARPSATSLHRNNDRTPVTPGMFSPEAKQERQHRARQATRGYSWKPEPENTPAPAPSVASPAAKPARRPYPDPAKAPKFTFEEIDAVAADIPAGYYALPRKNASTGDNDITFFEITIGKTGTKWAGKRFIRQLVGAPGTFQQHKLSTEMQYYAFLHIAESVPHAARLFGRTVGVCARCGSPLTNKKSRAEGLGTHCKTLI